MQILTVLIQHSNKGQLNALEVDLLWYNFIVSGFGKSWYRKHSHILEMLEKAKLHAPDTIETSKYHNLPVYAL